MKVCDESLPKSEHTMSNFDHVIDDGMEEDLRNGMRSEHAAWEFYGLVWFEDGKFYEMVKRYQSHVATYSAKTLEKLMRKVNANHGSA